MLQALAMYARCNSRCKTCAPNGMRTLQLYLQLGTMESWTKEKFNPKIKDSNVKEFFM